MERWVGRVDIHLTEPAGTVAAEALPEVVRALAERHPDPTWAVLQGRDGHGQPLLAVARRPLKRIDGRCSTCTGASPSPAPRRRRPSFPRPSAGSPRPRTTWGRCWLNTPCWSPARLALTAAACTCTATAKARPLAWSTPGAGHSRIRSTWPGSWNGWTAVQPFQ